MVAGFKTDAVILFLDIQKFQGKFPFGLDDFRECRLFTLVAVINEFKVVERTLEVAEAGFCNGFEINEVRIAVFDPGENFQTLSPLGGEELELVDQNFRRKGKENSRRSEGRDFII